MLRQPSEGERSQEPRLPACLPACRSFLDTQARWGCALPPPPAQLVVVPMRAARSSIFAYQNGSARQRLPQPGQQQPKARGSLQQRSLGGQQRIPRAQTSEVPQSVTQEDKRIVVIALWLAGGNVTEQQKRSAPPPHPAPLRSGGPTEARREEKEQLANLARGPRREMDG